VTRLKPDVTGRIITDPGILAGKPTIKGTRIAVDMVLEYLEDTLDLSELFTDYPDLTPADVQACLGYAKKLVQAKGTPRSDRQARSGALADS